MARQIRRGQGAKPASRRTRTSGVPTSAIPDVYEEMLLEAVSSSSQAVEESPRVKRRRVGERSSHQIGESSSCGKSNPVSDDLERNDESGPTSREEVGLKDEELGESTDEPAELNLVLGGNDSGFVKKKAPQKRKLVTAAEREMRIEIHKMHLLCLLAHVGRRNHWCNDPEVQVCSQG